MYVCVCVCMCICVCVCVCLDRSLEFFLLSLLRLSLLLVLRVAKDPGYFDLVFSKIFYTQRTIWSSRCLLLLHKVCGPRPKKMNLFEILNLLHRCIDSCWGFKALPTNSNYYGCPRSLLLYGCTTRRVNKETTIKVYSSTVKINERFGTAIAIWVFSIGSYSSTTGFIVICHS